jgi:hypothetical protein
MKKTRALTAFLILLSCHSFGQNQRFLATATTNKSIINYVHTVDSSIILIDFLKIKKI